VLRPKGGGQAVVDTMFRLLGRNDVKVHVAYQSEVIGLLQNEDHAVSGVRVRSPAGVEEIGSNAVILAAGGFEADPQKRAEYLGTKWQDVKVRGSRHNRGDCLIFAREIGSAVAGAWENCHSSLIRKQASSYELDNSEVFPFAFPYSLLVNRSGQRFVDEGGGYLYDTYSQIGKEVLEQPGGIAFEVYDATTVDIRRGKDVLSRAYRTPVGMGESLAGAASQAGIDSGSLMATVQEFNAAVMDDVAYRPGELDGRGTLGLEVDKTNWALRVDTPPFEIFAVEVGITFTYGGLKFDELARVVGTGGSPIDGLYAVGEIAGTFHEDYLAGVGMTKGAVFGRIAGAHAARYSSGR
jgi:tricarballylate dehydrogenase